ncbi:hypothetical protein BGX20_010307 [Mortierella sp. AD010]|nr:hypothetical protein BGX20_010307 [Mortierella sp. AD010]
MGNFRPFCVASNGERFYLVSLQPLGPAADSPDAFPALGAYTHRIILLQSQLHPTSLKTTTWTVVDSYPSFNSTVQTNELDILVGDFASGTSNCQVDSKGNFIWISSKSVVKSDPTSAPQITSKTSGVQFSVGKGSEGTWSLIKTSRLPGSQGGIDYVWKDEGNVNALFTIKQGVFVHVIASTTVPGITYGVLTNNNLVQSNRTWILNVSSTTDVRLFGYDGVILRGPFQVPDFSNQVSVSSFAAISGPATVQSGRDFLFVSMKDGSFGMTMKSVGFSADMTSYDISNPTTTSDGAAISPSPPSNTAASDSQPSKSSSGGIAGGVIAAICILAIIACRQIRRRKENIQRIFQEHHGPLVISPNQPQWTPPPHTAMPLVQQPTLPLQPANFSPMMSQEQHDQAQIELQRMRLGPTPLIIAGASPFAPPSPAIITEDPPISIPNPFTTAAIAAATAPEKPVYQRHELSYHEPTSLIVAGASPLAPPSTKDSPISIPSPFDTAAIAAATAPEKPVYQRHDLSYQEPTSLIVAGASPFAPPSTKDSPASIPSPFDTAAIAAATAPEKPVYQRHDLSYQKDSSEIQYRRQGATPNNPSHSP